MVGCVYDYKRLILIGLKFLERSKPRQNNERYTKRTFYEFNTSQDTINNVE